MPPLKVPLELKVLIIPVVTCSHGAGLQLLRLFASTGSSCLVRHVGLTT